MFPPVNTRNPREVIEATLASVAPQLDPAGLNFARATCDWVLSAFAGRNARFEALDTPYHDLEHTLQGLLCLGRLLAGWHRSGTDPLLDRRTARLALAAILLHDTGYLRERGDTGGTGGRFTLVHVDRGTLVAATMLAEAGLPATDIAAVQSMIRCTGPVTNPTLLAFDDATLRRAGCCVGTADLLGQMAAPDYLEKLPLLHREFAETAAANPECDLGRLFPDMDSLLRQTPGFWTKIVLPKLDHSLEGARHYLATPWPDGPNPYCLQVEANIARLRRRLETGGT